MASRRQFDSMRKITAKVICTFVIIQPRFIQFIAGIYVILVGGNCENANVTATGSISCKIFVGH